MGFSVGASGKDLPTSAGDIRDMGFLPGLEQFLEEGHGSPLQYSFLEKPMDRRAWRLQFIGLHRVRHS